MLAPDFRRARTLFPTLDEPFLEMQRRTIVDRLAEATLDQQPERHQEVNRPKSELYLSESLT